MGKYYKKVGQAAMEYLVVVSMALFLLTPVLLMGQNAIDGLRKDSNTLIARQTLNKFAEASELVYAQGPPAAVTIKAQLPANINETLFVENMIIMRLKLYGRTGDIISSLDFNVTGNIPNEPGTYQINIRAIDNGVNITQKQ
ncbi:MAG: hypothetical protein KAT91_03530 [Candidatus Aenigmarchaeota archaeon]|nr:hypothetical protein [Candidatus Aenigmarchaeota archaeon]